MSESKKYFWLKLKKDFFEQREIKKLRKVAGGDKLTIIYLRIQLLSLQDNANLLYAETEKNIAEQIALELDEEVDNVKILISFLEANKLVEVLDNQDLILIETQELIGSETYAASRMRKSRMRKSRERVKQSECNIVTPMLQNVTQSKSKDIDIDIDKDIDKDIKLTPTIKKTSYIPYDEIINFLNKRCNTNFRSSSKKTQKLIQARINDGYKLNDFFIVINNKSITWLKDPKMVGYLRPETLFSNKFESYLNEKITIKNKNSQEALENEFGKGMDWVNEK